MEENNENLLEYYKEAYDREKQRGSELAEELADANAKAAELSMQLNRIKGNPLWKMSKPLRVIMHFFIRNYQSGGSWESPGNRPQIKEQMDREAGHEAAREKEFSRWGKAENGRGNGL